MTKRTDEAAAAAGVLSAVQSAIEAEQLEAEADQIAYLRGAIAALKAVSHLQGTETNSEDAD